MWKRKLCMIVLGLLCMGIGSFPREGTAAMVRLSLGELTRGADTIVLGTVTARVSAWNSSHTAIYTDVTMTVDQVIKGAPGSEVMVRIAGGVVGEMGMRTSTAPALHDGEQVMLFLQTRGAPATIFGHYQGAYPVTDGMVTRDGHRMAVGDFIQAIRAVSPQE